MGTVPKPVTTRLAHNLKQTHNTAAVHGQQIIQLQSKLAALGNLPAAGVAPAATVGSTYSQTQVNAIVATLNALIASLQNSGILS